MSLLLSATLPRENRAFGGTGGRSQKNRGFGFRPAFMDSETGGIYSSRFSDGSEAPFHLLDGLPDAVALWRRASGCRYSNISMLLGATDFLLPNKNRQGSGGPLKVETPVRELLAPLRRSGGGSHVPIRGWFHYADHELARMYRSQGGSNVPITKWLLCAGR